MSKYKAVRTMVDDKWFDSKREASVYQSLKALERAGTIRGLECQVRFPLHAVEASSKKEAKVCVYVADFVFQDLDGRTNVYDAKGYRTPLYRLKAKWFEIQYGIRVVEV